MAQHNAFLVEGLMATAERSCRGAAGLERPVCPALDLSVNDGCWYLWSNRRVD